MSTQHPDNVNHPFFSGNSELGGEDEIKEVFYTFSHMHSQEQLWDCEGKEVDNFVVKKLLSKYEHYFRKNKLGKDVFLTLRVPNPSVEKNEAKILLETLESIPRNFDAAKAFYDDDIAPIFEIALPMTTDYRELVRISKYYKQYVVGKQHNKLGNDMTIAQWIGKFKPESLRIIPLIEDKESILNPENIVEPFLKEEKTEEYQRVWLARSDPALNYGNLATVLMLKVSLQKLRDIQEKLSIDILPILGCGSAPFRGNFKPTNIKNCVQGYPSIYTYTLQSAFKYDYGMDDVTDAVKFLNETRPSNPVSVDEKRCVSIIEKLMSEYRKQVKLLGESINNMSPYIPPRRKRKLHIGLFGYSRSVGDLKLPRAITFCASLYSYGLPPEIIGLNALDEKDIDYIKDIYANFDNDLRDSLKYLNKDNLSVFPKEIVDKIDKISGIVKYDVDKKHKKVTSIILEDLKRKDHRLLSENITRAGFIRGFLG
ncbi:phosphoenolpyruvate carboxylase [Candidatus Woesearchaeota archaeon]|jgi:phosphoenolpyruvate carboxylase|nr:phosphoenolpyruvate carboxylase [Candidatus Woesearchaeota archaeon]MAG91793.1 phosphoenolpyruvate carboxylase [Candidatus Woesearchaeota archaeon]|tara:strand:- start:7531 stop:8979 length:1449 start_codon:yes stop_codon:yes gene_type:complete